MGILDTRISKGQKERLNPTLLKDIETIAPERQIGESQEEYRERRRKSQLAVRNTGILIDQKKKKERNAKKNAPKK